jgi:hypothetical protein
MEHTQEPQRSQRPSSHTALPVSVQIAELEAFLDEARSDRGVYLAKCEDMKTKQKAKRKDWADERKRLLRCLEAQTRHNTIHLQVRTCKC